MIKIKNIYYMLAYAYQALNESGYKSIQAEEFRNVHDLLSAILIRGISQQIKRGLHRDYIGQTDSLSSLRGKIDVSVSIKQQTMMIRRMVCHYDLFLEDTLVNRILKTTMYLLLRRGELKQENRQELRRLILYFANVKTVDPYHIRWKDVSYH